MLQLYSVEKSFGIKEVINNISFILNTGDILGVFGRNGSGKSTLLKMLYGTLKADSIEMSINDNFVHPSEVIKNQLIGYLPQHSFVPAHSRVRDIIAVFHPSEEKQDAVFYDPIIAKIAHKKVRELSKGTLKYFEVVLIGNANHPFLMLDEPFSMLEPLHIEAIREFLINLSRTKGILITDHYYKDVLSTTTKNIVLKEGNSFKVSSEKDLTQFEYLTKK